MCASVGMAESKGYSDFEILGLTNNTSLKFLPVDLSQGLSSVKAAQSCPQKSNYELDTV